MKLKEEIKLKKCPFCGGVAGIKPLSSNEYNSPKYHWFYPTCLSDDRCPGVVVEDGEMGGTYCDCKTREEARELWNKRVKE